MSDVCGLEGCENPSLGALYCSTWCWDVAGNQPWTHETVPKGDNVSTDDPVKFTEGPYGFAWGAMGVERTAEIDGRTVLSITTDAGRRVEVYVSRTGRSLRVFDGQGGEWSPPVDNSTRNTR